MNTSDLSTIVRNIRLRAPRSRVWRAISDPEQFGTWFRAQVHDPFEPGARVRMTCQEPGYEGIEFEVVIQEIVPEQRISWRWHPGAEQPPEGEPMTLVVFELHEEDGVTVVTLTESGFDRISAARRAKVHRENSQGWEAQAANLENYVGISAS